MPVVQAVLTLALRKALRVARADVGPPPYPVRKPALRAGRPAHTAACGVRDSPSCVRRVFPTVMQPPTVPCWNAKYIQASD